MAQTKQLPHKTEQWQGYTLDEMRYMRAYTAARIEISRDRIARTFGQLRNTTALVPTGLLGKLLGSFTYVDMGIIAYRVGRQLFKTFKLWKGGKRR